MPNMWWLFRRFRSSCAGRPQEARLNLAAVSKYEAVDLFTQRVRAIRPDFRMTEADAVDIVDLCRHLDGLPLAIELAAAASREHSPAEISQALSDRFSLLAHGYRDLPPRQQTMRRAIAWSHDLLSPQQRGFSGDCPCLSGLRSRGCSSRLHIIAASPLRADGRSTVFDGENLLVIQESDFGTRHTMLETIREFGLEVLNEAGEEGTVRALHASHFMELAERAAPELTGPEQAAWFDRLETEHDNVRAALAWALDTGEIEVALRLGSALTRFWLSRGYFQEGRRWIGTSACC